MMSMRGSFRVLLLLLGMLSCLAYLVGCEQDLYSEHARLVVSPELPQGVDPLDVDTLWVYAENTRSGRVDSLPSEYAQAVEFDVEVGNYTVRAVGSMVTPKIIYRFSGIALNRALPRSGGRIALGLERSLTLNPDAPHSGEGVECIFHVSLPSDASSSSLEGGSVRAVNQATKAEYHGKLSAYGSAVLTLPSGVYLVEVLHIIRGDDGGVYPYYTSWDNVVVGQESVERDGELSPLLEPGDSWVDYKVRLEAPQGYADSLVRGVRVRAHQLPTGQVYEAHTDEHGHATLSLPVGSYRVALDQVQTLDVVSLQVRTFAAQPYMLNLQGADQQGAMQLRYEGQTSAVVIKEVYFSASTASAPGGGTEWYGDDKFFEIYNNSPFMLYADGISMCATKSNTMIRKSMNFFPERIGTDSIVAGLIFTVPGDGKTYPLPPGKTMVFADIAIDHRQRSFSTVDLSKADFEYYDDDPRDMDVPEVPNLDKWYSYSKTITTLHVRGYWGLFIMKGDAPMREFLARYLRPGVYPNGHSTMIYCIPKEYILDAVQTSAPTGPVTQVFPASLDVGYTYCTKPYSGRSIRRKVSHREGDRWVLMDTNNSSVDFHTDAIPAPGEVVP